MSDLIGRYKNVAKWAVALCLVIIGVHGQAQKNFHLKLETNGQELPKRMRVEENFRSTEDRSRTLNALLATLYKEGHLAASIDSLAEEGNSATAYLYVGDRFEWAELRGGNVDQEILSSIRFREKLFYNEELNPDQVAHIYSSILGACEDNGYPFASVRMKDVTIKERSISAELHLEKNALVKVDSVIVRGDCRTAPIYIYNYISVRPGDLYDESNIEKINTRLKELPFLKTDKPYYVLFGEEETKLYLFLSDKKASRFNGIIGVLPDPASGEVTVTGDIQLRLKNAMKHGELIDFNWRKLQTQTQDLKINFNYPYLFNTPFGADLLFKLYKRDTTFIELNAAAGIQYLMRGTDNVRVYVRSKQSNKLGNSNIVSAGLADIDLNYYGVGVSIEQLDYRLNPRKGIKMDLDGAIGNKKVSSDELVDEEIQQNVTRSTQFDLVGSIDQFVPLGGRSTLRFAVKGGWMINDDLYENELYRIGGIKSLRGTDEESIFASAYAIGTVEYRFIYETNANFYLFFDGAYWENQSLDIYLSDTPIGFGVGTSFETKAGIFSLSYALGKQFDAPIQLNAGKVHFGFTSLF